MHREEELVRRAQRRDPEAFGQLYEEHYIDYICNNHPKVFIDTKKIIKDRFLNSFCIKINEKEYKGEDIISNGSCTTNCLAPMIKVLDDLYIVEKRFMTTTHSYTNDQRILDLAHKDVRRSRAAAVNIIPTTSGAAKTVGKVIKHLEGKLDGIALRVPTPVVSIVDFICLVKKPATIDVINFAYRKSAEGGMKGVLAVSDEGLVSQDFKDNPASAIVDLPLTMVKDNMVKVVGWYDNEWGYSNRLVEMAEFISK